MPCLMVPQLAQTVGMTTSPAALRAYTPTWSGTPASVRHWAGTVTGWPMRATSLERLPARNTRTVCRPSKSGESDTCTGMPTDPVVMGSVDCTVACRHVAENWIMSRPPNLSSSNGD